MTEVILSLLPWLWPWVIPAVIVCACAACADDANAKEE